MRRYSGPALPPESEWKKRGTRSKPDKVWGYDELELIWNRAVAGWKAKEIADDLGLTKDQVTGRVARLAKARGVSPPWRGKR